jgi:hypothetical protein
MAYAFIIILEHDSMLRRYRTVIPLHFLKLEDKQPFELAPNFCIDRIPDYFLKDTLLKRQSAYDLQQLEHCSHAFIIDYEAEALYCSDPLWMGNEPRTIEAANVELAYLANLGIWIQHPSPVGFNLVFHMPESDGEFVIQGTERVERFLCHPDDSSQRPDYQDLKRTKRLFEALRSIPRHTSAWTALRATVAALQTNPEEIRYALLWIALEALFGSNTELKYRISQRIAFFIAKDNSEAKALFSQLKKAYDFRSRIVHGTWKSDKDSTALTATVETILRRAAATVLDNDTPQFFIGSNNAREAFLDDLVFAGKPYSAQPSR